MEILKRAAVLLLSGAIILSGGVNVGAEQPEEVSTAAESALLPAFPGAEGAGMYATGGRGGKVYHVTNLNDSGSGSFRDAVSGSNRIVVFDIGGTITLKSDVIVKNNIIILGQTAPGGAGITLSGYKLGQGGSNQIIRFISSRPGERGSGEYDAWGGNNGSNSIIDHCSIGWANDEQWGLYSYNMNQTVQYSIIGPSNCISTHAKGAHGFGIMFGKGQCSWHHNMIAHNISRNFRGKVERANSMDFVNNVLYDWGYQTGYGTLGHINYVNNYLKAGNSTKGSYHFFVRNSGTGLENYKFYVTGNKIQKKDGSPYNASLNNDNWKGVGFDRNQYGSDTAFEVNDVNGNDASVVSSAQTADEAFATVLAHAGAGVDSDSRPRIDREVMDEAKNGTGYLTGGRDFNKADSEQKKAIKTYNIKYVNYDEYYPAEVKKTIIDTDGDGMPDDWEKARGLNPNKDDSRGDYLGRGYMNIEYYANDLTVNAFPEGVVEPSIAVTELGDDYKFAIEDADAINLTSSVVSLPSDVVLPSTGSVRGSQIVWSSASSRITVENNAVTKIERPSDSNESASVMAEITHGSYTVKRYYNINIKSTSAAWVASSDSVGKKPNSKLMEGLYNLYETSGSSADAVINGKNYDYYISGNDVKDGNNNTIVSASGAWSNGKALGVAFKYTPSEDGFLTAYITKLGKDKTAYICEEGAENCERDALAKVKGETDVGDNKMITAAVEAGKVYYVFVSGSKGRFLAIEFQVEAPIVMWKAVKNAELGEALMKGLTTSEGMTYTAKNNMSIDGVDFSGCIAGVSNPSGTPKGSEGAALKYTASENQNITVYYKVGSGKVFKITDDKGNIVAQYENEKILDENNENIGQSEYTSTTAAVRAGSTYYIYIDGSKAEFYGISTQMTASAPPMPSQKPDDNTGVRYTREPAVSGKAVTAGIQNNSGRVILFVAAAYDGDLLVDVITESVPSGDEKNISGEFKNEYLSENVKYFIWDSETYEPKI